LIQLVRSNQYQKRIFCTKSPFLYSLSWAL